MPPARVSPPTRRAFRSISLICAGIGGSQHPVKSTRERAEEKRQEKLELVREQVQSGSLVIRKMTDEERQRYPVVAAPRPRRSAW